MSATEQKFSGILSKKFQKLCQNCFPRVQKNTLLKQQVWRKKVLSLADIERKIVGFCKRIFKRVVERAFFASIGTLWGEHFSKKYVFFSVLDIQGKNFGFFGELLDKSCKTVFFSCPWELFEANEFFLWKKSHPLWILVDELLSVCWGKVSGVIKTAFYEHRGIFWAESCFWGILFSFSDMAQKNFRFFSQFFERVRQNWVPRVHRKNWGQKHTFCLKMYFYNFRTVSRIFRRFVGSFPPGLSKVHSTFPWNQFEGNRFWEKSILCRHWVKQVPAFGQQTLSSVVKNAFYESIEKMWGKVIRFTIVNFFKNSRTFTEKKSAHFWNFSGKVFKTAKYMSIGTRWGKIFWKKFTFVDNGQTFFGFFSKHFRHSCQNCILYLHQNILKKTILGLFSRLSDFEWKSFSYLWENIQWFLQNCLLLFKNKIFKRMSFFEKNFSFFFG